MPRVLTCLQIKSGTVRDVAETISDLSRLGTSQTRMLRHTLHGVGFMTCARNRLEWDTPEDSGVGSKWVDLAGRIASLKKNFIHRCRDRPKLRRIQQSYEMGGLMACDTSASRDRLMDSTAIVLDMSHGLQEVGSMPSRRVYGSRNARIFHRSSPSDGGARSESAHVGFVSTARSWCEGKH